jgi:hypothetical protein
MRCSLQLAAEPQTGGFFDGAFGVIETNWVGVAPAAVVDLAEMMLTANPEGGLVNEEKIIRKR